MVCGGTGCYANRSQDFREALRKEIVRKGLADEIKVIETGCNGFCAVGPVMLVQPERHLLPEAHPRDDARSSSRSISQGPAGQEAPLRRAGVQGNHSEDGRRSPFSPTRCFWVMRNKGVIDPEVIDEYIARDGYFGVAKALKEHDPRADHRAR